MSAYVITDIHVTDPERYEEYRTLSTSSTALYGGKFIVRGGAVETLEGEWQPHRVVIIEFPDAEHLRRWWSSPEYEAAKAIRRDTAESKIIMVEGV